MNFHLRPELGNIVEANFTLIEDNAELDTANQRSAVYLDAAQVRMCVRANAESPISLDEKALALPQQLTIRMSSGRGQFIFRRLSNDGVRVERPLGTLCDLYYCASGTDIFFATDCNWLTRAASVTLRPDRLFVLDYLVNFGSATDRSPWEGVFVIPPGQAVEITNTGMITRQPLPLSASLGVATENDEDRTLSDTLIDFITCNSASDCNYVVELSGGVDSTGLVYAALEAANREPDRVIAVTYLDPQTEDSEDVALAKEVARRLGITHLCIPFPEKGMALLGECPEYLPSRPSMWLHHVELQRTLLECLPWERGRMQLLNGHGGDHVFVAHPNAYAVIEEALSPRGSVSTALRTASNLARLTRRRWVDLASETLREANELGRAFSRGYATLGQWRNPVSPGLFNAGARRRALEERRRVSRSLVLPFKESGKWHSVRRLDYIREAVNQGSSGRLTDDLLPCLHPYLAQELIRKAVRKPIADTFDERYNRKQQREGLYSRFGDPIFLRRSKGNLSGVLQRALYLSAHKIGDLTSNGIAVRLGIIDEKALKSELERAFLGSMLVSPDLFYLISLESFYQRWNV